MVKPFPEGVSMYTVAFANQICGMGKTTLCREIGIYLSMRGSSVLIIDADILGSMTQSLYCLPLDVNLEPGTLYDALADGRVVLYSVLETLYLLKSDIRLAYLERSLEDAEDGGIRLKRLLADDLFAGFDFILIDAPSNLDTLCLNVLAAATHYVVPINPALFTMYGNAELIRCVTMVRSRYNPDLKLLGSVINAFERAPSVSRRIESALVSSFSDAFFSSVLSRTPKVDTALALHKGLAQLPPCPERDELELIALEFVSRLDGFRESSVRI